LFRDLEINPDVHDGRDGSSPWPVQFNDPLDDRRAVDGLVYNSLLKLSQAKIY